MGGFEIDSPEWRNSDHRLPAHEEIAGDRHERDHRQVLVDRGDSGIQRVAGTGEGDRLAFDEIFAASRPVNARQRFD